MRRLIRHIPVAPTAAELPAAVTVVKILLVISVVILPGCNQPSQRSMVRLLDVQPAETLDLERWSETLRVFEWSFREPASLQPWSLHNVERAAVRPGGGLYLLAGQDPQMVREIELMADEIDTIHLVTSGPAGHLVQLFWAGPGENFETKRSILLEETLPRGSGENSYAFNVGSHSEWTGAISKLRLDPTAEAGQAVYIQSVSGSARVLIPASLEPLGRQVWQIDLDADVRNGVVLLPEASRRWRFVVPPNATLRVSYGLLTGIRILDRGSADDSASCGGIRLEIATDSLATSWSQVIEPKPPPEQPAGWTDVEFDLRGLAGTQVALRARSTDGSIGQDCLPVLANPEVIGDSDEREENLPNVILISLDTLRADHLSLYGYERETSPQIDVWAERYGVTFSEAVASSPWTLPSHLSMFSGVDAHRHGVNHPGSPPGSLPLLPEMLRDAGYTTLAITGGVYLRPEYGFHRGFDVFRYWPTAAREEAELRSNMDEALALMEKNRDRRFFLFFHTYEIHHPYRPRQPHLSQLDSTGAEAKADRIVHRPRPHRRDSDYLWTLELLWRTTSGELVPLPEVELSTVHALYDSGILYTDSQLQRLFLKLEELNLVQDTIVVLTSDHGESFGEHGLAGHSHLYDDNLLVPLVIAYPRRLPTGRRVEVQARLIDVVPTILELAGLPQAPEIAGKSLVQVVDGRRTDYPREAWSYAAEGNFGISLRLAGREKYIYNNAAWSPIAGKEQLFSLLEDPLELENVAPVRRERSERLREHAVRELKERPGLRLGFRTPPGNSLRGSVGGTSIIPSTIKSPDLTCDCVHWGPQDHTFRFSVPPGTTYELILENVHGALDIEVAATSYPGQAKRLSLDPRSLGDQAFIMKHHDGQWHEGAAPVETAYSDGLEVRLWWKGKRSGRAVKENEELERQLRALGYVN